MKKKMKSYFVVMLAISLLVGCLAGCGQSKGQQSSESSKQEQSNASSVSEQSQTSTEEATKGPITTEPVTISILTTRHSEATNEAEDIWFFQYLEHWLAEQGYNVTIEVSQTQEYKQQLSLMLGTGTLPDIVWSIGLEPTQAVLYGAESGMILDWTPYINEDTMPNFYREIQKDPDALIANTCVDGKIYSLPHLSAARSYGGPGLSFGMVDRMYVNETWLEECGLNVPTNLDEFLDMLRAFRDKIKLDDGSTVIPLLSNANFFEMYLWMCMGYYGKTLAQYGQDLVLKDDQLVMPVYTEDYKTFIEIMKTCYDEGLISPDYFTMDGKMKRGLSKQGVNGVECDYTLGYVKDFSEWVEIPPFSIGGNDKIAISLDATYKVGTTWASANTKYPEICALIVDYLYSPEGAMYYTYGPMQGQDPLGKVDGWYFDENGTLTTKLVANGTFENFTAYARQYIRSQDNAGKSGLADPYAKQLAGLDPTEGTEYTITDAVKGTEIVGLKKKEYSHDDADGHWRLVSKDAVEPYLTTVRLPAVYLDEEDTQKATDLKIVLDEHIKAESAKFITGIRPISEIDKFFEELKKMGIEELIDIYTEAYSVFMESTFN